MSQLSRQERLRRRTGELSDHYAGSGERFDEPPRPGDVFAFAETAEHYVQWAVIDRSRETPRRLLAVAADLDPMVGSADVAVEATAPCGALTLRCAVEIWLDAEDFDPELRTGSLSDSAVDRARSKRAALVEGDLIGSALERETDREPEYHDVLEELREARAALRESRRQRTGKASAVVPFRSHSPEPVSHRPGASRWGLAHPYGVAASILLVVTLGLTGVVVRLLREMERDEQLYQQRIADLEQRLEGSGSEMPFVDVPFAWLSPLEQERGDARTISLSASASYLVLILEVSDPEPYSGYRLEIREVSTDAEVFTSELSKTELTEVSVALPRRLLDAGEYQLRLYGLRGVQAKLVEEYALRIDLE